MNTVTMTSPDCSAVIRTSARRLLAAWNSGDLGVLKVALDRPMCEPASASEMERMEMVEAVADTIRTWIREPDGCPQADLDASLRLLRHLAGCSPKVA
jgi:hypothetical protein